MYLIKRPEGFVTRKMDGVVQYLVSSNGKLEFVNKSKISYLASVGGLENYKLENNKLVKIQPKLRLERVNASNFEDLKYLDYLCSKDGTWQSSDNKYGYADLSDFDDEYYTTTDGVFFDKRLVVDKFGVASDRYLDDYTLVYEGTQPIGAIWFVSEKYNIFKLIMCLPTVEEVYLAEQVCKSLKNAVYSFNSYLDCSGTGLEVLDMRSKVFSSYHYCGLLNDNLVSLGDKRCISDKLDAEWKKRFKKSDLSVEFYKIANASHLAETIQSFEEDAYRWKVDEPFILWKEQYSSTHLAGFRYFCLEDIMDSRASLLLLTYQGTYIGVVKFNRLDKYTALSYLEINKFYKTVELENYLITLLNNYLDTSVSLILPIDNEEEVASNLSGRIKELITVTKVKTYEDCMRDGNYN
jgi:hypothetical protein